MSKPITITNRLPKLNLRAKFERHKLIATFLISFIAHMGLAHLLCIFFSKNKASIPKRNKPIYVTYNVNLTPKPPKAPIPLEPTINKEIKIIKSKNKATGTKNKKHVGKPMSPRGKRKKVRKSFALKRNPSKRADEKLLKPDPKSLPKDIAQEIAGLRKNYDPVFFDVRPWFSRYNKGGCAGGCILSSSAPTGKDVAKIELIKLKPLLKPKVFIERWRKLKARQSHSIYKFN